MVPEVASALARLGQRGYWSGDDDLVFVGDRGGFLDASAMRRRYVRARDAAGLRPLRFHDLRHVFGSLAIRRASIVQVQTWMGHADIDTTRRYLHHRPQADDAKLLAQAFKVEKPGSYESRTGPLKQLSKSAETGSVSLIAERPATCATKGQASPKRTSPACEH